MTWMNKKLHRYLLYYFDIKKNRLRSHWLYSDMEHESYSPGEDSDKEDESPMY